ncbi:MAG: hypothetical protein KZQ88_11080 [Candidatus Thiodiazotropha sp. (ex Dulcina madagascariensis)]|nr:hypothetical protein [Candidatus Thiodiazotropha sp. (ex Epidulcina cf. delphinae)]MCU7923224.1 hypothetical protein [Candidatus Thiodiazotropha sp. (ex Dulcina madagascariensis)]MCU7929054.1 hypothetical protein [Candidatus Thiodiazotropha sp. (ex Dulcina madagascariensis)]
MIPKDGTSSIESPETFSRRVTERLSQDGFDVEIRPGVHLVDDAGADSLVVLYYVLILQELGLKIDLAAFDTDLLDIDVAYKAWIRKTVARAVS